MTDKKKSVVLRAPVISQSGYGTHARQVARFLLDLEKERDDIEVTFDIVPWGITPWYVDAEACNGLIGQILQKSIKKDSYDVSLQLQLPNEWNPFLAAVNIGMTAAVETDRCNPEWVEACNRMHSVIVPSEFTKKVLENSGELNVPVNVVPESWMPAVGEERENTLDLKLDSDFNFLLVSQFTGNNPENDRKNIAYTLKWTMEQFKDNTDVGVVVKTNFGRMTKEDKHKAIQIISNIVAECQKGPGPRIYLLHGHMTDKEMVDLYRHPKIKALLSLTRGEGFGLPILEAATCGLPVIATNWSAHTEFLKQGKYIKVDYNLIPIHQTRIDNNIFMQDAKWANPLEEDYKRKVKKFYESSQIPTNWAKELSVKLLESHSEKAIQQTYREVLKDVI